VAWAKAHAPNQQDVAERKAWLAALEGGRSPFDPATLDALRNE
jgi:hypothetical protein